MSIIALLDLDIYAFRAGFSCESKVMDDDWKTEVKAVLPVEIAYARVTEMIDNTLRELGTTEYRGFINGHKGNYREQIAESYKANRKDVARPIHLPAIEQYLIAEWGAIEAIGEESDDLLGIAQTNFAGLHVLGSPDESIIVTIDKDLNMIPGKHYNFVKCEFTDITPEEAEYNFYKQLLMGDSTDNISGCPGIGPKKAEKALMPCFGNEQALFHEVYENYKHSFPQLDSDGLGELITVVGRLIWIRQHEGELWTIPNS